MRHVWAYYLSFWAGEATWAWQDALLTDTPLLGRYNSKLLDTAAQQIRQAQDAGITAFWVNWWGLDENVTSTPALVNLLGRAQEQGFQLAVVLDLYLDDFNRDLARLEASLRWVIDHLAPSPAYLRYRDKPLIAFAFPGRAPFTADDWRALRDAVDPQRETWWLGEGLSACCLYDGAMDGMYAFNMAWADGDADFYLAERDLIFARGGALYVPSISPGWDESAVARATGRRMPTVPRDRAGGQFFTDAWNAALQTDADAVLIVSWNEFIENSHVEPSVLYGTQALDTLRPLAAAWFGAPPTPFAGALPARYAAVTPDAVPVRAAPQRDAAVIGKTTPGSAYWIVGEESGLYAVQFGDTTGYLPFELLHIRAGTAAGGCARP